MVQVRSLGNGLHPVGPLTVANYALNPSMELPDTGQLSNSRVNLDSDPSCTTTSSWIAYNGSTTRVDLGNSLAGSTSVLLTFGIATGLCALKMINLSGSPVGHPFSASFWARSNSGHSISIQAYGNYYNTGSGLIQSSAISTFTLPASGAWVQCSLPNTAVAPTNTNQLGVLISANGASIGDQISLDAFLIEQATSNGDYFDGNTDFYVSRTNLCTNPSFETGTAGWTTGGGATLVTSTAKKVFGSNCGLITWPGSGLPLIQYDVSTSVGTVYTVSAFVWVPSGSPAVTLTQSGVSSSQNTNVFSDWQRLSYTFTATATTTHVQVAPTSNAAGTCFIDGVLIEQGGLTDYFDGSLPKFNSTSISQTWTGTPHASTSIQRVPVGTVSWSGTANASTSTRQDVGVKDWTPTNAIVTQVACASPNGLYCAKMTPTSTSLIPSMSQTFNVFDLTNYSISFLVYIPATLTGGGLSLQLSSFDITSAPVSVDFIPLLLTGAPTTGFVRVAATYQTPAGTSTLGVAIRPTNQPSSTADTIFLDNFLFEKADTSSASYLDGSFAGYCWSGTPHDSTTLRTEFPDALNFFGTYIWQNFNNPGSTLPMGAHATLHESPWSPAPLTD